MADQEGKEFQLYKDRKLEYLIQGKHEGPELPYHKENNLNITNVDNVLQRQRLLAKPPPPRVLPNRKSSLCSSRVSAKLPPQPLQPQLQSRPQPLQLQPQSRPQQPQPPQSRPQPQRQNRTNPASTQTTEIPNYTATVETQTDTNYCDQAIAALGELNHLRNELEYHEKLADLDVQASGMELQELQDKYLLLGAEVERLRNELDNNKKIADCLRFHNELLLQQMGGLRGKYVRHLQSVHREHLQEIEDTKVEAKKFEEYMTKSMQDINTTTMHLLMDATNKLNVLQLENELLKKEVRELKGEEEEEEGDDEFVQIDKSP